MAVRFSATGQSYTGSLSLGSQTQMSLTLWAKISTNRATWSGPLRIGNTGDTDYVAVETQSDGTSLNVWDDAGTAHATNAPLTVGTWYFVAVTVNGTGGTFYTAAANAAAITSSAISTLSSATVVDNVKIGEGEHNTEWLNGCVTAVKIWS